MSVKIDESNKKEIEKLKITLGENLEMFDDVVQRAEELAAASPCCLPRLLQFCPTDMRSPLRVVLNHLCTLSELVGASSIRHRRIFGTSHFLFFCELRSLVIWLCGTKSAFLGAIELNFLQSCFGRYLCEQ